jgi:uncharacterized protein (TIGR03435 family)
MRRTIACASLIAFMSLDAPGQTPAASSGFEVASIRLNKTGLPRRGSMEFPKGGERFTATNIPLGPLLLTAYNITVRQISAPASFPDDRYDIAAKADHPLSPDEMRHMLQQLLADRFKLVVQTEIKEVPVYALVIGKGGEKLTRVRNARATRLLGPLHGQAGRNPVAGISFSKTNQCRILPGLYPERLASETASSWIKPGSLETMISN